MKNWHAKSFAIGIVFGLLVLGCVVGAANSGNANTGWRYEFIHLENNTFSLGGQPAANVVFDRETGTVNAYSASGNQSVVLQFQPE